MFMMQIDNSLWLGDSAAERSFSMRGAVALNVANDMTPRGDNARGTVAFTIGLVDGPGNRAELYCAAIYALHALRLDNKDVFICCHSGTRALAICIMYSAILANASWDTILEIYSERFGDLPVIDKAHKQLFEEVKKCVRLS